jgi:cellulose synthase/poly-beta-1,6-N-acetylglucosamine synthase-like glycosyltransferase
MIYLILILLGIGACIAEIFIIFLWVVARWKFKKETPHNYTPKTCIIVPCKGLDINFRENINAFCTQNYKEYTILFITDSAQDAAYGVIQEILPNYPYARLLTADSLSGCSGKIAALLKGIEEAGDVEVYVFADSDIKPHKEWLYHLVSALDNEHIGATTGYRWYFPHSIKSLLISTWNMAGMIPFFYPRLNYTWGGSTSIRKDLFEKLEIAKKWRYGFADDLILTNAVKKAGYLIQFIPKCIVESDYDSKNIHQFLRWGTREFIWARWYNPLTWSIAFIRSIGIKFLTVLGVILLFMGFLLPGVLMISTILLEMICGGLAFITVKKTMWYSNQMSRLLFSYAAMMPIAFFIITYNLIASSYKKEVQWGGRTYLKSDVVH